MIDEILRIAHSHGASIDLTRGSKAHVRIAKQLIDGTDPSFRFLLSGIEMATRHPFFRVLETGSLSEWFLRSPHVDVTARCTTRAA